MKIKIKPTEKNVALLKKMASKDRDVAYAARVAMAQLIGPVLANVIDTAPTLSNLYTSFPFNENDSPSIPLDLYVDINSTEYLHVWSQSVAGGMPFNQPTPPSQELKFTTYKLDSAVAFDKKYAQQSRLDVVAKSMERMAQEVLYKQETNAAGLLLRALALALTPVKTVGTNVKHVIRTTNADQFILHDLNRLFTMLKRIHSSWNFGTPVGARARGLTDLIVSPEMVQELRGFAYNSLNSRAGVLSGDATDGYTSSTIPLPDAMRQQIFNNAGIPEFMGVNIMEINELGIGYRFNDLFDAFAASTTYPDHGYDWNETSSVSVFNGASEELMIGLDLASMDALIRPVATNSETGESFQVFVDDQHVTRSGKIGWYGELQEGRLVLDDKILSGLVA